MPKKPHKAIRLALVNRGSPSSGATLLPTHVAIDQGDPRHRHAHYVYSLEVTVQVKAPEHHAGHSYARSPDDHWRIRGPGGGDTLGEPKHATGFAGIPERRATAKYDDGRNEKDGNMTGDKFLEHDRIYALSFVGIDIAVGERSGLQIWN
jgi:hypothetical protein